VTTDIIPSEATDLDLHHLSPVIAAELAAGLVDAAGAREKYGLSVIQWGKLARNPAFRQMCAEAIGKFKGDLNAGNRITLKAEILLEEALPELSGIAMNRTTPAADRINAMKELRELSGRNAKKDDGSRAGGGFVLNINVGKGQGITIEGQKVTSNDDNG
jgi:hypothetical protein